MLRVVLAVLIVACTGHTVSAESLHVLKGRIIRSVAIDANDPSHILVGQKAKAAGSALVFRSLDGGKSWQTQNGNKPLHPKATDVQAVLAVSKQVMLAGTWKHGLYISRNGGQSFDRISGFPSADIRDLQLADGVIYAATARHGVLASSDVGRTWKALGPGDDFLWSLTVAGDDVFANSPEKAVYQRKLAGSTWRKIFKRDGANAIAVTPGSGALRAIAGAKGLYLSSLDNWRKVLASENFADILITRNNRVIAGSWDKGIAVLTSGGHLEKRLLNKQSVIHLQTTNRKLYAGTWGDGLHIIPMAELLARPGNDKPLIAAVLRDDFEAVERLLATGAEPNGIDANRNTALTFAARDGQVEIAKLLLDAGADPGWIDGEGVTPLILASFKNHPKIVVLLLTQKEKVRPGHTDKTGRTALDYAKRRGTDDPIFKLLVK